MSEASPATPAPSQSDAATAKPVIPVSKNPRHKRRRIVPWNPKDAHPPIFKSKLYEFLQHPRTDFSKGSRFLNNPHLTAADWICLRMIASAMEGDIQAAREIADRVDGRIPLALPGGKADGTDYSQEPPTVAIVYESAVTERERHIHEAMQRLLTLLPANMADKARKLLKKPEAKYVKQRALPGEQQIEYIEPEKKR